MKKDQTMWEWIFEEICKSVRYVSINKGYGFSKDDIISEVSLQLVSNKERAEEIYRKKEGKIIYMMCRHAVYEQKSKRFFSSPIEYSRYQRIREVCEKYDIEFEEENAYKISAILESDKPQKAEPFSITAVKNLIAKSKDAVKYEYEKEYTE